MSFEAPEFNPSARTPVASSIAARWILALSVGLGALLALWVWRKYTSRFSACRRRAGEGALRGEAFASEALLIDVRSKTEFDRSHIAGAIHIPHRRIVRRLPVATGGGKPVLLYCRSGRRSGIACRRLRRRGYTQVFNAGGYRETAEGLGRALVATGTSTGASA